jgi:hypothetical protein
VPDNKCRAERLKRPPSVVYSQVVRHRDVAPACTGSNPVRPPNFRRNQGLRFTATPCFTVLPRSQATGGTTWEPFGVRGYRLTARPSGLQPDSVGFDSP